jgi:hypothetical protein
MKKNNSVIDDLIPIPNQVSAPVKPGQVSLIALRRQKVRELHRQGFDPKRISMILEKGVKGKKGTIFFNDCSEKTIKKDINYISQEEISEDKDYITKRTELLSKLNYLYNQAMISYRNSKDKSSVKATFLRTAIDILSKISEIEGLGITKASDKIKSDSQSLSIAEELRQLPKEDRDAIESTFNKILDSDRQGIVEGGKLLLETSRISTQASNNEGISGKSKVHKTNRQSKTSQ